ncbi:MAG: GPP34 family phosphoprotein, partial [Pirellulaceae bacterium]
GTHRLSSTRLCFDSQRYPKPQKCSYTLAGKTQESEDKVLWIFTRKIYPEMDPRPENQLVEQIRMAICDDKAKVAPRTAVVLSLAHATGMLGVHFDRKELKRRKKRIEQIASGEAVSGATKAAVQAAQAAMIAAQTAATAAMIASTSASS